MSTCTSCREPVVWAKTEINGVPTPLDPVPDANGNVEKIGEEPNGTLIVRVLKKIEIAQGGSLFSVADRYRTHFETCPNAKEHRR